MNREQARKDFFDPQKYRYKTSWGDVNKVRTWDEVGAMFLPYLHSAGEKGIDLGYYRLTIIGGVSD